MRPIVPIAATSRSGRSRRHRARISSTRSIAHYFGLTYLDVKICLHYLEVETFPGGLFVVFLAADDLSDGRLIEVLPETRSTGRFWLVWP